MKKKNDKKYVIVPHTFHPTQIEELSMFCVIIYQHKLDDLFSFIVDNGGRVISAIPAYGVGRNNVVDYVGGDSTDNYVVVSVCQKEIVDILMLDLCRKFEFNKKNNGKAFVIDVLGYMGAKGPFVE